MAKKMGLEDTYDDMEIEELSKDVHPEKIMDMMEQINEGKNRKQQ
jgi:hypothetical protein